MNRYYIELQNKLTDRIRVTIAEMNNNVFELSEENKELQQIIDKAIKFVKENACYDKDTKKCCDDLNYNECDKLLEILGDKENERLNP